MIAPSICKNSVQVYEKEKNKKKQQHFFPHRKKPIVFNCVKKNFHILKLHILNTNVQLFSCYILNQCTN